MYVEWVKAGDHRKHDIMNVYGEEQEAEYRDIREKILRSLTSSGGFIQSLKA
jgi:hypothetical protein